MSKKKTDDVNEKISDANDSDSKAESVHGIFTGQFILNLLTILFLFFLLFDEKLNAVSLLILTSCFLMLFANPYSNKLMNAIPEKFVFYYSIIALAVFVIAIFDEYRIDGIELFFILLVISCFGAFIFCTIKLHGKASFKNDMEVVSALFRSIPDSKFLRNIFAHNNSITRPKNREEVTRALLSKAEHLCALALIFFFLFPWVNIGITTLSGYQIPDLIDVIKGLDKLSSGLSGKAASTNAKIYIVYVIYLIPLFSALTIVYGVIGKNNKPFAFIAGALPVVFFGYWLFEIGSDVFNAMGIGAWLTLIAAIVMLLCVFDVIKLPTKPEKAPSP